MANMVKMDVLDRCTQGGRGEELVDKEEETMVDLP
jgi:hypothetical protein